MKSEVKEISPTRREIHIEIDPAALKDTYGRVSQKYAKGANVPGFRKGLAPLDVIRLRYKEEIKSEVLQQVVPSQVSEAIQEHIGMKCFLGELAAVSSDASKFEPLLTKLIEDVRHHVKEEEGTMFPAVQKRLSTDTLDVLGAQMEAEKKRFQSSAETIYG